MHLALAQLFVIFFVFISEINRKKKMTVVCPSTTRTVLNDFDWVENAGILSSFIPVEKCPSVMTLDCVQKHVHICIFGKQDRYKLSSMYSLFFVHTVDSTVNGSRMELGKLHESFSTTNSLSSQHNHLQLTI